MFWTGHFIVGAISAIAVLIKIVIDNLNNYDCVDLEFSEYVLVIALFLGGYVSFLISALVIIITIIACLIEGVIRYIEKKKKAKE